ncbi:family 16 glycosylhydrolase [Bradyrhizobium yuanmingense]|uniref:carbohydrate-binding domain-containing protein n=1 Tax=Bradyrhizobium TaxID=374 RepID=UPI001CD6B3DB|nr:MULTISPECIES: carbohydrate-binding domain-containing protein [unclassified Bradyrhizobium]MCA1515880.1 family 16 glycosylhydrolase [Bradyrhizobium sp. NBAIM01]UWU85812.1 family 16 glycosylhydrolase [Bradyrhizobium sp. CB1024]
MIDLSGYKLTFDDEFNSRSISLTGVGTKWADTRAEWRGDAASDVGFGTSSFVDPSSGYDPFSVSQGALAITAVPDRTPFGVPGSWESGLITTQGNFSQQYGYFEIRAELSSSPGAWDAFWLLPVKNLPDPNGLGRWQELDVVEHYGVWSKGVYSTIHTTDPVLNENWQTQLQVYSELPNPGGYHTYGVNWQNEQISFYIDGQLVGSRATPSDMHQPMYLLANLATQEPASLAQVPITIKIDYIRVYSADPSATAVSLEPVSSPAGDDPGTYGAVTASSTPQATPTSTSIGAGPDRLVFKISEDAYLGDALYTISVDGNQVGGTLTAHASHVAGQSDIVAVHGDWGAGDHTVLVHFLNDRWDGTPNTDRNLYVDSVSFNGANLPQGAIGNVLGQTFSFHDAASADPTTPVITPPPPTNSTGTPSRPQNGSSLSIGAGPDQLIFKISEDAYLGDALYTISVDGNQIGGTLTAHASHAAGQSDTIAVHGDWGPGDHTVLVHLLNDRWDGTWDTDRNLYVDSVSFNGANLPQGAIGNVLGQTFSFHDAASADPTTPVITPPPPTNSTGTPSQTQNGSSTSIGAGPDQLVFKISEDAYLGDALYTISVDGNQVGGTLTAHASHAANQSETIAVHGDWGPGDHTVLVHLLNDRWDGTLETDRNLYVDSVSFNGTNLPQGAIGNVLGQLFSFHDLV